MKSFFYKAFRIVLALSLISIGYLVHSYQDELFFNPSIDWKAFLGILASFLSPIFAILVSELWLKRKVSKDLVRQEVLQDLMKYRGQATNNSENSAEFVQTLNQVLLYWGNSDEIKKLVYQFRNGVDKNGALIEMIYQVCQLEGINYLSREDILNTFIENKK